MAAITATALGPICAWSRAVDSDTRCFSDPRGPVATTHSSSDRSTDRLSTATS